MTREKREEAIAIIRKEYLCVDRDCDIERSCGKCDLVMPSKEPILEAYKMAIKALGQDPCEDAIGRSDMLDAIGHGTAYTSEDLQRIIKGLPPVNPQPKIGHWIFDEILDRHYYCSECKSMGVDYWDYCPNCGAKMEEVEE